MTSVSPANSSPNANRDAFLRKVLWATVVYNIAGAAAFAFPSSVGQLAGLPVPVAPIYSVLLAIFVLLFGGAYVWLALQPTIDRPLVGFAAVGKASVFAAAIALWATGEASVWFIPGATGDLIFAAIFVWWLRAGSASRQP
jgi:Na+/melibiose symporter-like transporter